MYIFNLFFFFLKKKKKKKKHLLNHYDVTIIKHKQFLIDIFILVCINKQLFNEN